jgi:hypothetical protein
MNSLFQNVVPEVFVQRVGSRQVHFTTQDVAQLPAQPSELKQSDTGTGFIFHQDVHVAAFFTLSPGNRSKEIKAFNRKPAHDILIISQHHQSVFSLDIKKLAQAAVSFKFYAFGQGIRMEGLCAVMVS